MSETGDDVECDDVMDCWILVGLDVADDVPSERDNVDELEISTWIFHPTMAIAPIAELLVSATVAILQDSV